MQIDQLFDIKNVMILLIVVIFILFVYFYRRTSTILSKSVRELGFVVWGQVDLSPLKGDFHMHFHLKSLELIWMASESWGMARFGLYGLY